MKNLVLVLFFIITLNADEEYKLGEGIQVGNLPIYVGGYISTDYKNGDNYEHYRIDDLAFISYGSYKKFSYMAEFEFKELYVEKEENKIKTNETNDKLYTERIYIDYQYDENSVLKIGKYNSPIGYWNLLPVNVLRETTSNPKSSYIIYPKFTTGLDISYATYSDATLQFDFMLQRNNGISDDYNNYQIDKHYGIGVTYELNEYSFKLNTGCFNDIKDASRDNLYYALLSAKYENNYYQITAELGSQKSDHDTTTEYAGYLQGVYWFSEQHIGILRYESFKDNIDNLKDDIAVFGYTYRPLYPIAIKTKYQLHSKNNSDQFLFSFSVMF